MKVLIINIDSKMPNLALKKIEKHHRDKGDEIVWDLPILAHSIDKIYVSCIYSWNRDKCKEWEGRADIGGSGYDLGKTLPPKIDKIKPQINIGFTTRGCIRRCPFCIVPQKEGKIRIEADIYDIWDGKNKSLTLLDNNILALPKHFEKICYQLIKENISVDFNQGLDIRLVTPAICRLLAKIRIKNEIRFAFDFPELAKTVVEKLKLLKRYNIRKYYFFYVLVGFNTTFKQDMERLLLLKKINCRAYIMRHENTPKEKRYIRLAQWVNQFWTFQKYDFETFCKKYDER